MKILQVFDFFSLPHGGGTVDIIIKLSKALADRGHEVAICTGDFEVDHTMGIGLPLDVHVEFQRSEFNRFGIYYMPNLHEFDVHQFDVIHFHCYRSFQNTILYRKAVKAGVPYIIDAHGSTVDHKGPKQVLRKLYDYVWGYDSLKHASRVIAETEIGVAEWRKLGVPDSNITLLHPFIDIHEFENLPDRGTYISKFVNDKPIILFMGRINKDKGLAFLVRSFHRFLESGGDAQLVIAGEDDGYKDALLWKVMVKEQLYLANKQITFVGFLTGEEKLSALVDASMLIQPSRNEAGARPSLEALMCGTPTIVTMNTGAGLEIAKMDAGITVEYNNVQEMADAMSYVLDYGSKFPERQRDRIEKAKQYIKDNLSIESRIVKYENLYKEVMV